MVKTNVIKKQIIINILYLFLFFTLFGCAAPMDYMSPGICITGSSKPLTIIYSTKPYNKKHMNALLKGVSNNEMDPKKEKVNISDTGEFKIHIYGFRRNGLFWILPPLGGIGLDRNAEIILTINNHLSRGIILKEKPEIYVFDPSKREVVQDKSGLIKIQNISTIERPLPYSWHKNKKETIKLFVIKIAEETNNTQ